MSEAIAQTPGLTFEQNTLWVPLIQASTALDGKVEVQAGQRVFCKDELCLLLRDNVTRQRDGVEWVDLLWLVDALDLRETEDNQSDALAGRLAPDFTLPDLDGTMQALSDFRGKKTIIYMWGSW